MLELIIKSIAKSTILRSAQIATQVSQSALVEAKNYTDTKRNEVLQAVGENLETAVNSAVQSALIGTNSLIGTNGIIQDFERLAALSQEALEAEIDAMVAVAIGPQPFPPGMPSDNNGLIGEGGLIGENGLIGTNGLIGEGGLDATFSTK